MVATTKTPLGAETTNRKFYLDVDTTPSGASSTWVPVLGITNFQPNADAANLEDDSDFDSGGFMSQIKTATAWSATATVARKVLSANSTQYDPGQEYLRTASIGKVGVANVVHIRYYEMEPGGPRIEAYTGYASVSWQEQGGDMKALDTVQVTLAGRGQLSAVAHPDTAGAVVPVVNSVSPSAISTTGGQLVTILGTGFTGTVVTTGVKFGTTNATSWVVVNDSEIIALTPAHAAGTVAVAVTNATSWVVVNDSEIIALTPAHAAGTVAVAVTNAVGVSTVTQNAVYS